MIEHMFASGSAGCKPAFKRQRRAGPRTGPALMRFSLRLLAAAGVADLGDLAAVDGHLTRCLGATVRVEAGERPALLDPGLDLRGGRAEAHVPVEPVIRGVRDLVVVDH